MENQKKKQKPEQIPMLLHPNEVELIDSIRHRFRFGKIEVVTMNGLPIAIEKTVERVSMNVAKKN